VLAGGEAWGGRFRGTMLGSARSGDAGLGCMGSGVVGSIGRRGVGRVAWVGRACSRSRSVGRAGFDRSVGQVGPGDGSLDRVPPRALTTVSPRAPAQLTLHRSPDPACPACPPNPPLPACPFNPRAAHPHAPASSILPDQPCAARSTPCCPPDLAPLHLPSHASPAGERLFLLCLTPPRHR
jgi:hypothetical protein